MRIPGDVSLAVESYERTCGFTAACGCATCGCGTYSESPDWSTGKPDFDKMKVGVNAWLFDDFNLDAVPVVVIDGKNLW